VGEVKELNFLTNFHEGALMDRIARIDDEREEE